MNTKSTAIIPYLVTIVATAVITWYVVSMGAFSDEGSTPAEKKPLYWVAPMDPNFRRNEPGLSPMGMDLVPVYDEPEAGPGVVSIQPHVVNQLGVRTEAVAYRALEKQIRTVGYIRYDDNKLLHVHPRVKGWINELYVKSTGLQVTEGQPLFSLYSPELINAQEEYLLALTRGQQRLIQAARARLESLQISSDTIEQLTRSRQVMQNVTFHASSAGVVSQLAIREGFYVQPGDQIMSLADLSSVWLEAELTEQNLAWITTGTAISLQLDALPGQIISSEVDFIYPFLDERSKTAIARLTLNNESGTLKPNMIADVLLLPDSTEEVLSVPHTSVIRTGTENRVVWAKADGQYKSVAVELGRMGSEYVEITAGLADGDEVVTAAQFLLDSESSQQSDLRRFEPAESEHHDHHQMVQSARTSGLVNEVMGQTINISRGAIEKWNRPPATMDFLLAEGITAPMVGSQLEFTFEILDGDFIITDIHRMIPEQGHDH